MDNRVFVALLVLIAVPSSGGADSLLGGIKDKAAKAATAVGATAGDAADAVGKVADKAASAMNETVESTKQSLADEATPQETRAKLDAMAERTLERLFEEYPDSRKLFDASAGYAVFDVREVSYTVSAGYGRGVAVNRSTGEPVYMKMGSAGVGMSFGIGGFESQVVILFENDSEFETFVTQGYDASAQAGTMTGDDKDELVLRFDDGRAVFVLTKQGWKVSAKLTGTRYWPDASLN